MITLILLIILSSISNFVLRKLIKNLIIISETCLIRNCPKIFAAVCGSDLRTYPNECTFQNELCLQKGRNTRLRIINRGPCQFGNYWFSNFPITTLRKNYNQGVKKLKRPLQDQCKSSIFAKFGQNKRLETFGVSRLAENKL